MSGLHSRTVELVADNSGSAAGSIGVPTGRYAGTFYNFKNGGVGTINVENLRRSVFSKAGATNADAVTELTPANEHLIHGEVEVSVGGATVTGGTVDVTVFVGY